MRARAATRARAPVVQRVHRPLQRVHRPVQAGTCLTRRVLVVVPSSEAYP
jgi:hypothetical protein